MLKILKHLNKRDIITCAIIIMLVVGQVFLEIEIPRLMGEIVGRITGQYGAIVMSDILSTGGIMLALAIGSFLCAAVSVFLSTRMATEFSRRLRAKIFAHVEKFSMAEVNKFSPASLITRTTNDVVRVQMIIGMGVRLFVRAPVMAIWAITRISGNWQHLSVIAIALSVMVTLVVIFVTIALPKFRRIQGLLDNINRLTRENLSGIRVVRAYNAQEFQKERFEQANAELTRTNLFVERFQQIMMPFMMFIISGITLSITIITAFLMYRTTDTVVQSTLLSDMITFNQYAMMVIMAFVMLVIIFSVLPRASVSAKRILEVLETPSSVVDGKGLAINDKNRGIVEFKNVSFKYPDAEDYILQGITFKAERGEVIAFIGSTGSGKSSLINLVPRFYDASGGEVLIAGEDIKNYKLNELNSCIGYIPQKGVLFSGTIKDNIAYGESGSNLTESEILEAAEIAQATDFILAKEDALEGRVAQTGINLSGGQKQRISIARALAKKPDILIFDDSFSALDFKTDRLLRDALKSQLKGVTQLVVAQRIGTIKNADKIMVLEKGKCVGFGKHEELLEKCEVYREIALSQLSSEELV